MDWSVNIAPFLIGALMGVGGSHLALIRVLNWCISNPERLQRLLSAVRTLLALGRNGSAPPAG